ncbi:helix-turn-helix transcriptional regulator [Salinibacterium sp. NSLL150]|uniref:ArsR/SmtB family transcription factor n=1 Tax=unclassified Salinibacterium TaxID=2632331 RepID=UPI0018CE5349|nr:MULTISPECIES: metalloregulator ArsR/SmtB family transcription factor [unclassified Salinibacterium]MBH0099880.1 helix-turn-helix transcriptional regulator [Salinibacterium sp. NSLL35]MBH0102634.1 helix-turn-helix transcriptional regulator [Salinibacterium sp. NSLL150]MBH0105394.1 helix-turn-helix transcriptional regulator [Salinibacterium sp. NSLL16]MBH0108154.1 helix-turn-helix transcriptional regulator [Salinibacterium sp. NSLL17]MBH0110941.1 helix-turn-helix transcriptional regulator [Sa
MSADISDWSDPSDDYVSVAVEIFSLLADATRFRIVLALREGELAVGEIAERVSKPQATVSQHLAKLRMSRVVTTRHEGARVYYRLSNDHALELIRVAVFQAEHAVDDTLRHSHHAPEPAVTSAHASGVH